MEVLSPDFVTVLRTLEREIGRASVVETTVRLRLDPSPASQYFVGVDPGQVNMGITILSRQSALCVQVKIPSTLDTVERVIDCLDIMAEYVPARAEIACVEQAAYAAQFGQAALAENRTAAVIGLLREGTKQIVVPVPGTIRKRVFGSAKQKAELLWPFLPPDAASSLCCALYARLMKGDQNE